MQEVATFAEKVDLSDLPAESNPSFSIIIDQIKFAEDAHVLLEIIKEAGIFDNELEQIKKSLNHQTKKWWNQNV